MSAEEQTQTICVSCGHSINGKFCSDCGEKVMRNEDKSVLHFFEEFVHLLTHADSKFLKSLKYLFIHPGLLTSEYLIGRRKKYAGPLTLFFIGNLIYLLILPVDALNSKYESQIYGQPYSASIAANAEAKMNEKHWTKEEMTEHYNHTSGKVSKMLLVLLIVLFSVPISILFYKRDTYYFDHLVFATEFVNFIIYAVLLLLPYLLFAILFLLSGIFHLKVNLDINSGYFILVLFLILWTYLTLAAKRVYKVSWVAARTFLLAFSSLYVVYIYRYILFHITLSLL